MQFIRYRKTATSPLRALTVKQTFRPKADEWCGPAWLAAVVAKQLIQDGCAHAEVHELPVAGYATQSRILDALIPNAPVAIYRAARNLLGRRTVLRTVV